MNLQYPAALRRGFFITFFISFIIGSQAYNYFFWYYYPIFLLAFPMFYSLEIFGGEKQWKKVVFLNFALTFIIILSQVYIKTTNIIMQWERTKIDNEIILFSDYMNYNYGNHKIVDYSDMNNIAEGIHHFWSFQPDYITTPSLLIVNKFLITARSGRKNNQFVSFFDHVHPDRAIASFSESFEEYADIRYSGSFKNVISFFIFPKPKEDEY